MANEEQLSILKQGVESWNKWRQEQPATKIDLEGLRARREDLFNINLKGANLARAKFDECNLIRADLSGAILIEAGLSKSNFSSADLSGADLTQANLTLANLENADLTKADLTKAILSVTNFHMADLSGTSLAEAHLLETNFARSILSANDFTKAAMGVTVLVGIDLHSAKGLESVKHDYPSYISTDTIRASKGKIPTEFLRGCGLGDWEIESVKLYNPDLNNAEISEIQYKIYDLRATRSIQLSPLFISYSHNDSEFVDKLEQYLNEEGVRFWRDIHDMKSGRMEKQIDRAMRLNPTVVLILSEHSLQSDWVEHEVRTARALEKEMKRDLLCPVTLDDSWKNSPWSKRVMEQILEYNILDFSKWKDETKFEGTFNKLIDGLELFYK